MASVCSTKADFLLEAAVDLEPDILAVRGEIDRTLSLPASLVAKLQAAGLFHLWLPQAAGGPELSPLELMPVIEALGRADGSVAWCAANACVLSFLAGGLSDDATRRIFAQRPIAAGSAAPVGRAVATSGGYRLSGKWSYISGILHSDWLGAAAVVYEGETPRLTTVGSAEIRILFFPKGEATVLRTWNTSGMRGTGSHDFTVDGLFVAAEDTAILFADPEAARHVLYRMPPLSLFGVALASVALGIADAAVGALRELALAKTPLGQTALLRDLPATHVAIARAEALIRAARAYVKSAAAALYDAVEHNVGDLLAQRCDVKLACTWCAEACAEAVDLVYGAAGVSAMQEDGRLARCFRDIHATTQHITLSFRNYEPCGRVLSGLDPGAPRF